MPEQEMTRNSIMPISEDVGFDLDHIADNSLNRETACVDLRINAFYHYTFSSIRGLRHGLTVLTQE